MVWLICFIFNWQDVEINILWGLFAIFLNVFLSDKFISIWYKLCRRVLIWRWPDSRAGTKLKCADLVMAYDPPLVLQVYIAIEESEKTWDIHLLLSYLPRSQNNWFLPNWPNWRLNDWKAMVQKIRHIICSLLMEGWWNNLNGINIFMASWLKLINK